MLEVENDCEHPSDSCEQVPRIERVRDSLVDWQACMMWSGLGAVFGRAISIPESDCQNRHFHAGYTVLQAVEDIVVGESLTGLDNIVVDQDAENNLWQTH